MHESCTIEGGQGEALPGSGLALLRAEHDRAMRVADVTDFLVHEIVGGRVVEPRLLHECWTFFHHFTERSHNAKEEELLLPQLCRHGLPAADAPMAMVRGDHALMRDWLMRMEDAAGDVALGLPGAEARWARAARAHAGLLRAHVAREDSVLYRLAERLLPGDVQQALAVAFSALDRELMSPRLHARLNFLAEALPARLPSRTRASASIDPGRFTAPVPRPAR